MKHLRNLRKIVVGDNYDNAIKYIRADKKTGKGPLYSFGEIQGKICDMIQSSEDPSLIDIYVTISSETVYWKSVPISKVLDFENDVNFE
jgi:hypothetical protein